MQAIAQLTLRVLNSRICRTSHCGCRKRRLSTLGPLPQGEPAQICPPPSTAGVPRMQKFGAHLVGAQGYQRFPLSKSMVGQNIAVHAVPAYMASTYLVSAFPAHSTSFSLNVSILQRWNVYYVVIQNSCL